MTILHITYLDLFSCQQELFSIYVVYFEFYILLYMLWYQGFLYNNLRQTVDYYYFIYKTKICNNLNIIIHLRTFMFIHCVFIANMCTINMKISHMMNSYNSTNFKTMTVITIKWYRNSSITIKQIITFWNHNWWFHTRNHPIDHTTYKPIWLFIDQ